mmetsp:Transcript_9712/g.23890  ORF Transcript_9712/g.23890 Transcript_9712/m.23890 type:complete len:169 (-) Transcript_9712:162-668(-)
MISRVAARRYFSSFSRIPYKKASFFISTPRLSISNHAKASLALLGPRLGSLRPTGVRTISTEQYENAVGNLFDKLVQGLDSMKDMNTGFEIDQRDNALDVTIGAAGTYTFNKEAGKKRLQMFSPVSLAVYTYKYDEKSLDWISEDDGHHLIELLTRELLTSCAGVPEF